MTQELDPFPMLIHPFSQVHQFLTCCTFGPQYLPFVSHISCTYLHTEFAVHGVCLFLNASHLLLAMLSKLNSFQRICLSVFFLMIQSNWFILLMFIIAKFKELISIHF